MAAAALTIAGGAAVAQPLGAAADPWTFLSSPRAGRHESRAIPVKSYGPNFPSLPGDSVVEPNGAMTPEVKQSVGCLISGTVATLAAMGAGGENLVNIIAGGTVAPTNTAVLYIGLVGVVFASFCAIGQAITPLYLYYFDNGAAAPPPPADTLSSCPTCREAERDNRRQPATGPLAPELRRAGYVMTERVRLAGQGAAPVTVPAVMSNLAGPLAVRR
ncbi:MAG: hypothetical protein IT561_04925 [Alphaproteobacteria bacterium]|nr:hypothetical protein [Alphaproteobacteria bacterium]